MTSSGIAENKKSEKKSSDPCSARSGIDDALRRSDAKMEFMLKRMEVMMKQTSGIV